MLDLNNELDKRDLAKNPVIKIGCSRMKVTNINWYQDAEVIRLIKNALWEENKSSRDKVPLAKKRKLLRPYGTRLLIRVAQRLIEFGENFFDEDIAPEELSLLITYVLDVLKERSHIKQCKDAFIDKEFNPYKRGIKYYDY